MENWYYMSNKKRKRILKRIRSACEITMGTCLFMIIGIVGSVDVGDISLAEFFIYQAINMGILLTATWIRANV